ncbi:hypothetical protein DMB38_21345 [Streptomyces sp. WAC 06738]|nr:hypothetical protein DMB38_21345 [Streptomyces sp. WAC 06738]
MAAHLMVEDSEFRVHRLHLGHGGGARLVQGAQQPSEGVCAGARGTQAADEYAGDHQLAHHAHQRIAGGAGVLGGGLLSQGASRDGGAGCLADRVHDRNPSYGHLRHVLARAADGGGQVGLPRHHQLLSALDGEVVDDDRQPLAQGRARFEPGDDVGEPHGVDPRTWPVVVVPRQAEPVAEAERADAGERAEGGGPAA